MSLPLSILLFSSKSYIGFIWGSWASITGQMMLLCTFWAMSRINIKKTEILLGVFLGALALAHTSELLYGAGFIIIYTLFLLVSKKFTFEFFKKMFIVGIISGIIAGYSLFIFANSFMVTNPYNFVISKDWGGTPTFFLTDFNWILILLGIGLIMGFVFFKKMKIPLFIGIFMLLIGYTNYIGFGIRAFQPRLLWPVYFSFFFGMALYTLIKFIPSKLRIISVFSISAIFILAFSNIITIPNIPTYNKVSSPGLMDIQHWEAFQWISMNTPQDSKIYFFYGDVYNQDAILRNSKRFHAQVDPDDFIAALKNQSIKKSYKSEFPADHGAGMPFMKSFLNIELHQVNQEDPFIWEVDKLDVCVFNYHVFDKVSRQPVLVQYNLLLANDMVSKGSKVVFDNEAVVILKNDVGDDCIEDRNF